MTRRASVAVPFDWLAIFAGLTPPGVRVEAVSVESVTRVVYAHVTGESLGVMAEEAPEAHPPMLPRPELRVQVGSTVVDVPGERPAPNVAEWLSAIDGDELERLAFSDVDLGDERSPAQLLLERLVALAVGVG